MFQMKIWDRLLKQSQIMLNMIRPPRLNTKILAHVMLEGTFYYNRTPLKPPGTKVIVNEKPNRISTQAQHGVPGCYIGPPIEHYYYYKV